MLHESPRSQWEPQSPVESNHFHQEGNTISESDNFFGAFRKRSPSSDRPSLVSHIPRKTPSPTWRRDSAINTPPTDRHSWSQQTTWQPTDSRITRESRWHDEKRPRIADYYERRPRQQFEHSRR
ncbi:hypothetical protein GJ496_005259 [Pomphorhynchus laevis]|nr:hypothetical protein GJ496_005259 [Pomphorhynchus laevis]